MAWDPDEPADSTNGSTMMTPVLANWVALQTVTTSSRLDNLEAIPDFFPEGTVCWFYADAAPTGWTIVDDVGDELLAIKGGSYYETGASLVGSWQQPDHTLTISEIPSHNHDIFPLNATDKAERGSADVPVWKYDGAGTLESASIGGGLPHNHGIDWRPSARVGILCSIDDPAV